MIKNNKEIETINKGFITGRAVKKYINFFCAAVDYELSENSDINIRKASDRVSQKIVAYSNARKKQRGIRAVAYHENLLPYFFNQKNTIPGYICYWLKSYYKDTIPFTDESIKETDTYKAMQRLYIQQYRWMKAEKARELSLMRKERRKICRMYRSGKYATTFKLYGKQLDKLLNEQELKDIDDLVMYLFGDQINNGFFSYSDVAVGYALGRIQGRSETAQNAVE